MSTSQADQYTFLIISRAVFPKMKNFQAKVVEKIETFFYSISFPNQKHLGGFEMWCWRRIEKISWADHVRSEEVLLRVKEQRNILHEISKRKANLIGHILRRKCLLRLVIKGTIKGGIEVKERRGRRRRELLDDLKERRGYSSLKEEALDRTVWRAGFGRGFGTFVRQTAK
jgi:hypothetical protein